MTTATARLAVAAATGILLAGCGTQIDTKITNAQLVAGTPNLYYFCNGPILIFFSQWESSNDNYEAFFNGGCVWENGQWLPATGPPTPEQVEQATPGPPPSTLPQDDTNQQDERDEGN